ncbi:hypothetical protein ACP4OV_015138 [Aristida adscensionis]
MLTSILCGDCPMGSVPAAAEPSEGYEKIKEYLIKEKCIKSYVVSLGSELANQLLRLDKTKPKLLKVIFNVWVEMLLNASYRCSRESHVKKLSTGGELTSVVWLTIEHANLFPINKDAKPVESLFPGGNDPPEGPSTSNSKTDSNCVRPKSPPGSDCDRTKCICYGDGTRCICDGGTHCICGGRTWCIYCGDGTQCICHGGTYCICGDGMQCV